MMQPPQLEPIDYVGEVRTLVDAFAAEASRLDADAAVSSLDWPTAGDMVDHLGGVHRWASEILRSGERADRAVLVRPAERDRRDWFLEGADRLLDDLEQTDPERPCWTLLGSGRAGFWRRRMAHETAKHLWDLRSASDAVPQMPIEASPALRCDTLDEFDDVFISRARERGLAPLPSPIDLVPTDSTRRWRIDTRWHVERTESPQAPGSDAGGDAASDDEVAAEASARASARASAIASASASASASESVLLRAGIGDLVLFVWGRAAPSAMPDRFEVIGDVGALHAFQAAPVHP